MIPAKKVEVIVEALSEAKIIVLLEKLKIEGYSILKEVTGRGSHGTYDAEDISDLFKNIYVIIVCPPEQLEKLLEAIRVFIKKYGGIAFVSDVAWLKKS